MDSWTWNRKPNTCQSVARGPPPLTATPCLDFQYESPRPPDDSERVSLAMQLTIYRERSQRSNVVDGATSSNRGRRDIPIGHEYTRVHTWILRFDERLFIDRTIHAPRRPFSHVPGSQEVGKSSFFRPVSVPPPAPSVLGSPPAFLLSLFFFACLFPPRSFARARAVSLPFLGLSDILLPSLSAPSPSPWPSRPLHLPRSRERERAPSLIVHFADTVKTRFILVTRHKARPTNRTCQSVDDPVTHPPSICSCKGDDDPNELRYLLIKIIPLGSFLHLTFPPLSLSWQFRVKIDFSLVRTAHVGLA